MVESRFGIKCGRKREKFTKANDNGTWQVNMF
jgi:hypothetical protein